MRNIVVRRDVPIITSDDGDGRDGDFLFIAVLAAGLVTVRVAVVEKLLSGVAMRVRAAVCFFFFRSSLNGISLKGSPSERVPLLSPSSVFLTPPVALFSDS